LRDKRKKFVELAQKRVNRLLRELRLVGNLSNRSNYSFTDDEVRKIFSAIEAELRAAKRRFGDSSAGEGGTFKF
jgi:hypothetical protein